MTTAIENESANYLSVPGAQLYYQKIGSGPVLLMIPGGAADASIFDDLARIMADRYTVVPFDPRGISRSRRDDPAENLSLADLADDASQLLSAVSAGPAYVLGSSGGAVIGLALVERHPEQVRTLVAHEPPVVTLFPDDDPRRLLMREVYDTYRAEGSGPAMNRFLDGTGLRNLGPRGDLTPEQQAAMAERIARMQQNVEFFLAQYFLPVTGYVPDVARLQGVSTRVVVGIGADSSVQLAHDTALALADRLGTPAVTFPGHHAGYTDHPDAFAARLNEVLAIS
jgi:pimeloyl-ACP methyl ester carboxylesterase